MIKIAHEVLQMFVYNCIVYVRALYAYVNKSNSDSFYKSNLN